MEWGKDKIPAGAVITSINGQDYKSLISECLKITEGELLHFKIEVLNGFFSFFLYIVLNDESFTVTYKHNGKSYKKEVKGIETEQYMANLSVLSLGMDQYKLTVDEKTSSAVIRFDKFGADKNRFKNFLDSTFWLLKDKSIENLIIDMRYNGGGVSSRGDELLQYISQVPFQQFGKAIVKVGDIVKKEYSMPEKGLYVNEGKLIQLEDNPLRYNGDVYVLTSNFSFSSAVGFSNAVKQFNIGKIIGEETGGLIVCYANVFGCTLPNTKMNLGVSWQKYYMYGSTEEDKGGVKPHNNVPANRAMDEAMKIISNKQNKNENLR